MKVPSYGNAPDPVLYSPLCKPLELRIEGVRFLIEPTREGFSHPCTPQEIAEVLGCLPASDRGEIETVILKQPTRKQRTLSPVWGRLHYYLEYRNEGGPTVALDAQDLLPFRWSTRLGPDETAELERLERDGHEIKRDRRNITIQSTLQAVRRTVLFRTIPHEVGHFVDYLQKVERRALETGEDLERLWELYWSRPGREREDFANGYAEKLRRRVERPLRDKTSLRELVLRDGLEPVWFGL